MKPIVLLAFANDSDRPLDMLSKEKESIQSRLKTAAQEGLCDLKVIENANIDRILEAFRNHPGQIAIFHFAGHAGSYELCLEAADGKAEIAHAGGFAEFLSHQWGLQLVFLNGCSTQKQVEGLLKAKVGAVIATSKAIHDDVAQQFSSNFYLSMGSGSGIHKSFQEAAAAVKMRLGDNKKHRAIYYRAEAEETERFPWDFYVSDGAEIVREWNLPDAAGNPLFGLPKLQEKELPDKPFRYLHWFTPEDAEIFHGRGYQIRDLYNKIMDVHTPQIIHLYGRSGVGKSSLLAAGLFPRLKADHQVEYIRRNQESGLLPSLATAFNIPAEPELIIRHWLAMERSAGKPLTLILDQVEEVFTRPINNAESTDNTKNTTIKNQSDELGAFIAFCAKTFQSGMQPKGKLILSYRKEYLAEIENRFLQAKIAYDKMFLQNLQHEDILAAITGVARNPTSRIREKYQLEIEKELPAVVADDLLEDRDSPIAPVLQILLSKMWDETVPAGGKRLFAVETYQKLRKEGLLLGDFLQQKLDDLKNWNAKAVESGLVLGLLLFHTTPKGTAARRNLQEIKDRYPQHKNLLPNLLLELKNRYLLVEVTGTTDHQHNHDLSLAHDTLAPLLLEMSQLSDFPAQKAHRILSNKIADWEPGDIKTALEGIDLKAVEEGRWGMRHWTTDEKKLIEASRKRRARARRTRRRVIAGALIAVALIVVAAIVAEWQRRLAVKQTEVAEQRRIEAENQTKKALSNSLVATSNQFNQIDPTTSFRTAEYAIQYDNTNKEAHAALIRAFYANPYPYGEQWHGGAFYGEESHHFIMPNYDPKEYLLYQNKTWKESEQRYNEEYNPEGKAWVLDLLKEKESVISSHHNELDKAVYSPRKRFLLLFFTPRTDLGEYKIEAWDLQNDFQRYPLYDQFLSYSQINDFSTANFSFDDQFLVVPKDDRAIVINLHFKGGPHWENEHRTFTLGSSNAQVIAAYFGPSDHSISTIDLKGDTTTFNLNMLPLPSIPYSEETDLYCDLSGHYILSVQGKSAKIWNRKGQVMGMATLNEDRTGFVNAPQSISDWEKVRLAPFLSRDYYGPAYSVDAGETLVAKSKDGSLTINGTTVRDSRGNTILSLNGHASNIFSVDISPDNQFFLTSTCPKTGTLETKLWDSAGNEVLNLPDFGGKAGFLPGGTAFYTYLSNCCGECGFGEEVRIWPIDPQVLMKWVGRESIYRLSQTDMDRFGIVPGLIPDEEVRVSDEDPGSTGFEDIQKMARITGSGVNVRSAIMIESNNILGQLEKGMEVEILDIRQGEIPENDHITVRASTLLLPDGTEIPIDEGMEAGRIDMRDEGPHYEVVVEIEGKRYVGMVPGADLQSMKGEKWYRVQSEGLIGWVFGQFLEEL